MTRERFLAAVTGQTHGPDPAGHVCGFCGAEAWTAMWIGRGTEVFVCWGCAEEVLPALCADARLNSRSNLADVDHYLDTFRAAYYRAAAIILSREDREEVRQLAKKGGKKGGKKC